LPTVTFGEYLLDRPSRELRKSGKRIRLQEQPFQVLSLLLERAGDVVTRDELRQKLWPSSVYVDFDHGLNNAITRLRETLGDDAATPSFIETLPRLGYRFIHPIVEAPQALLNEPRWTRSAIIAAAVLTSIIATALLAASWLKPSTDEIAQADEIARPPPSIAVLPFVSTSADPESAHFADGLAQELLDKLAGISGLRVAGRTSSAYYKARYETAPAIARALKVSHVLEGSVQRAGAQLRITVQLVNAGEGSPLWSQTFDRSMTEILQTQEEIAIAVASALKVELLDDDRRRLHRRGTENAEAHRLYLIANAHLTGISVTRDLPRAKQLFEQAIERDSHFAAAHARLAYYYFYQSWAMQGDVDADARRGMAAAQRAVALDPDSSEALQARANFGMWRYRFQGDYQAFVAANEDFRRAIELDPRNDTAVFDYGRALLWHEPDLAQDLFERTITIEPLRRRAGSMAALTLGMRGQVDAARQRMQGQRERALIPQVGDAHGVAGFEQHFGRLDEAVVAARAALPRGGIEGPMQLWSLCMSLGDRDAAAAALDFGDSTLAASLRQAATMTMQGRYADAFEFLDRRRGEFSHSRILDLPAARLALIAGRPVQARLIIEQRLPDLVTGVEPVNGHNVIPALDLVVAWEGAGEQSRSRELLGRISAYLDDPASPRLPMFLFLRARAHALAREPEQAMQALDRAYEAGFRTTWANDLHPQPFFYLDPVELDPAFATRRRPGYYQGWISRIRADNARQLERLKNRDAHGPAA
jgi:TolB-like protein/DNA-binding winged helix-turn-helix (wHTH) protein